ncbi:MAG: L,D-transpeptidase [Candidatus Yanofskybacteria bacterium]|nr:L,D-transpeptidase [Candidatus Yanofskybacteria bacterium]
MNYKLLIITLGILFIPIAASASTAGEIIPGTPVNDPAIAPTQQSTSVPTPLNQIDPAIKKLPKKIEVDLSSQTLTYSYGNNPVATIKISSGIKRLPTPVGTFRVLEKIPVKRYVGPGYNLPNTKWNLKFTTAGHYIHGAYWHNNFGHPMSHGCVNVSYADMGAIYDFADVGTPVSIHN